MANRFLNNITINDSYTLPSSDGSADQIIQTDGVGNLTFIDPSVLSVGESEQVHIACKNTSGVAISKGDPVYITGTVGTSYRVEIAAADASNSAKMPAVGLAESDLAHNAEGFVIVSGVLKNLTTDPLSTGDGTPSSNDTVYVKSGGGLTRTKPTGSGNLIQNVGKVGRVSSSSDGSLAVSTIMRTNDVPNLTTGKIWVGSSTYTTESGVVHLDESNGRMGIGTTSPSTALDVVGEITLNDGGNSVYIGTLAGSNDDRTDNRNVGIGFYALRFNTTGNNNVANGYSSLYLNTTGVRNTASGNAALRSNTTGSYNTASGSLALYSNTTGNNNTANGYSALFSNTTGSHNTANGYNALFSNTTGNHNIANGYFALYSNTTGVGNTANGSLTLRFNTTGDNNTANGYNALFSNTTGNYNTANGSLALSLNTTGARNTANGVFALRLNTTGSYNVSNGYYALYSNTTGINNTANGYLSLRFNTTGVFNTASGSEAGSYIADGQTANTTGDYNVFLGARTKALADNDQNEIVIGYNAIGLGSNTVVLGNDSITTTGLKGNVGIGTTSPSEKLHIKNGYAYFEKSGIKDDNNDQGDQGQVLKSNASTIEWGWVPNTLISCFDHNSNLSGSAYYLPFNNRWEATSSEYYNNFIAPYDGRVRKMIIKHVKGTTPTATSFSVFRILKNGSSFDFTPTTTGGGTASMQGVYTFSDSDLTFSVGDRIQFGFITSGGLTELVHGCSATVLIEYTQI